MPLAGDHEQRLAWSLVVKTVPQRVGIVANQASVRHVFSTTPRELVVVTKHVQVYGRRPLPLGDRTSCSDVNVARDAVAVMAGDFVAVEIDDIQVTFPNLPHYVVVLL